MEIGSAILPLWIMSNVPINLTISWLMTRLNVDDFEFYFHLICCEKWCSTQVTFFVYSNVQIDNQLSQNVNFACINILPKFSSVKKKKTFFLNYLIRSWERMSFQLREWLRRGNISEEMMIFREYLDNEQSS